ncbi:class I SAM-dependent DNA methyltransferase [Pseudalkalibacillus sp. A8]|uniref:class I SAM-dependent DNA methyltransferase n=1 Tax=Pseudalkalibacillus sp. A8 TaxID=3382641 RepID=UPI0038B4B18F
MRKQEETVRLFNEWAKSYEEFVQNPKGPLLGYDSSLSEAASELQGLKFSTLLDIGIGTGGFAKRFNAETVHGIDLSGKMLEECKKLHPDYILSNGTFTKNHQASAAFEVVVSSFTFHEVIPEERDVACKETYRVLKEGGLFLLVDIMFASETARNHARKMIGKYWDDSEDYPLIQEMDERMRNSGFQDVQWKQTGPYHWALFARK